MLIVALGLVFSSCNRSAATDVQPHDIRVTYRESDEDFPNPERGFYHHVQTSVNGFVPLNPNQLKDWRGLGQANGANYSVYSTLTLRFYVLDGYTNTPLPASFLDRVSADFTIARQAGVKLILRFAYTDKATAGGCAEKSICPPYGDAPKNIVLQHLPILDF
jgi:hypothetical protein